MLSGSRPGAFSLGLGRRRAGWRSACRFIGSDILCHRQESMRSRQTLAFASPCASQQMQRRRKRRAEDRQWWPGACSRAAQMGEGEYARAHTDTVSVINSSSSREERASRSRLCSQVERRDCTMSKIGPCLLLSDQTSRWWHVTFWGGQKSLRCWKYIPPKNKFSSWACSFPEFFAKEWHHLR